MDLLYEIIGPDSDEIRWWQMGIRAVLIFILAILMMRYGAQRIFGKSSAFDIVLGVILGSVLSRAITGNAPFLATTFTSILLVVLHWVLAVFSYRYSTFGKFAKGTAIELIRDGKMQEKNMSETNITYHDLCEACRKNKIKTLEDIKDAFLERSGEISIIPYEKSD